MFEAEEDSSITQMELAVILKTALGVTHLSVSRLFNAIDAGDTGKITFGECMERIFHLNLFFRTAEGYRTLPQPGYFQAFSNVFSVSGAPLWPLTDKFRSFVDLNPDFAEDFLYAENPDLHSGTCHHHQTKTSPSSLKLKGTAIPKLSNGMCPDFSPNYHVTADGLFKKHNWTACWDETKASPGERRLFLYVCEAVRGARLLRDSVYFSNRNCKRLLFHFYQHRLHEISEDISKPFSELFCEKNNFFNI